MGTATRPEDVKSFTECKLQSRIPTGTANGTTAAHARNIVTGRSTLEAPIHRWQNQAM